MNDIDMPLFSQQYEEKLAEAQKLINRGNPQQAIEIYSDILRVIPEKTTDLELKKVRLQMLEKRGMTLIRCHMHNAAIADFEQYCDEMEDGADSINIHTRMARCYSIIGEHKKALDLIEEVLDLSKKNHTTPLQNARIYRVFGFIYGNRGNFDEATRYYLKALNLLRSTDDDKQEQAFLLNDLGIMYKYQSIFDKSLAAYQESLLLFEEAESQLSANILLNNIGEIYVDLFDFDKALHYHQKALSMITDENQAAMPGLMCDIHRNMGLSYYGLGQFDEGREHFKRAKVLNQIVRVPDVSMQVLNSYAWAECMRGNVAFAQEMVQASLELSNAHQSKSHRVNAYYISGLCHEKLGDMVTADQEWQKAIYLAHETGQRMLLWRIHAALAGSKPDADLAKVHYLIAANIIEQIVEPFTDEALRSHFLNAPPVQAVLSQVE